MFKRFTNRQLALFLLAVLTLYGLSLGFGGSAERTFDKTLSVLDTAQVQALRIEQNGQSLRLSRTGTGWQVELPNGELAPTADGKVARALGSIATLEAQRLVSRSEEDWREFQVGDSAGTRVQVQAGEQALDVYVGRFEYQPGGMMSYVRLAGAEETYAVSGYLQPTFAANANEWRDKTLLPKGSQQWQQIRFAYPGDSAFALVKDSAGTWRLADQPALALDQTEVSAYLTGLGNLKGQTFAPQAPSGKPAKQLSLQTPQGPITVSAYPDGQGGYLIESSANPGAYFTGEAGGVFEKLFVSRASLLAEAEEEA